MFPYQVTCPFCGAAPGFPCTSPLGQILIDLHPARVEWATTT